MASSSAILLVVVLLGCWDAALLQDLPLPFDFTSTPQDKSVLEGEDVLFECAFDSPVYLTMWQNDSSPFSMGRKLMYPNSRVNIEGTENTYNLRISSVGLMDEGLWECLVPGTTPLKQTNQLTVLIEPSISMEPTDDDVEVMEGETVTLSCFADGKPDPVVTWEREGGNLPNGNKTQTGESLVLSEMTREDEGTYVCSASNGVGAGAQESFDVDVLFAPTVSVEESVYYKGSGDDVEIECTFESNPPVQVIWMLNGEDLNLEQRANIQDGTNKGDNPFSVGHYLEIQDLKEEDFGQYTCKGGNSKGHAESVITISGLPHGIEFVSGNQGEYSDQYKLVWDVTSKEAPIECELKVQESDGGAFSGENVVPCVVAEGMQHRQEYVITGLQTNKTYSATVRCKNNFGLSDWAEEFDFHTSAEERPGPPPPTTVEMETEKATTTLTPVKTTERLVEEATTEAVVVVEPSTQPDDDLTTAPQDDDDGDDDDDAGDDLDDDDDDDAEDVKDNGNTASRIQTWISSLVAIVSALYLCHLR